MLALFFIGGGPNLVIGAVYDSLLLWPIMASFPEFHPDAGRLLLGLLDKVLLLALLIGGPIILVLFAVEAAMALISRISPQLPMSDLSLPIKGIAVFAILPVDVVFMGDQMKRILGQFGGGAAGTRTVSAMNNDNSTEERALPPSHRKLQEARRKGQVSHSQDLVNAAVVIVAVIYLWTQWTIIRISRCSRCWSTGSTGR